eukprot:NODE_3020_length_841_cov_348.530534.p2 GENE.NODE_3020_length_841_cov_348.530534~~NODE_3020_length_841_cov_348.530534.p2  ORF type:complete len:117 (+),score=10.76 NODE_3020_length_841_cov_348.530534:3-353(+)
MGTPCTSRATVEMEVAYPSYDESLPADISIFNGRWYQPEKVLDVCEIRDGVLKWASVFQQPDSVISLEADGTVRMDLGGTVHTATVAGAFSQLNWDDSDVWVREDALLLRPLFRAS